MANLDEKYLETYLKTKGTLNDFIDICVENVKDPAIEIDKLVDDVLFEKGY